MDLLKACVQYLAWPISVLLIFAILKDALKSFISSVSNRISDHRSDFHFGSDGISITAVAARSESSAIDIAQLKDLFMRMNAVSAQQPPMDSIPDELENLANQYEKISVANYQQRLAEKEKFAIKMGSFALENRVSKAALGRQNKEGLVLALAAAVHALPEADDARLVINAGGNLSRLHVKYWVVLSIGRLFEKGLGGKVEAEAAMKLLETYLPSADVSLRSRIEFTKTVLKRTLRES